MALVLVVTSVGSLTVSLSIVVQPLKSVMVTSYIPIVRLMAVGVVWLPAAASHWKLYGAVPPIGLAVICPSASPKQETLSGVVVPVNAVRGWLTVTVSISVQPLKSVTTTSKSPAINARAVGVVWEPAAASHW